MAYGKCSILGSGHQFGSNVVPAQRHIIKTLHFKCYWTPYRVVALGMCEVTTDQSRNKSLFAHSVLVDSYRRFERRCHVPLKSQTYFSEKLVSTCKNTHGHTT